jgi:hypothetical protein
MPSWKQQVRRPMKRPTSKYIHAYMIVHYWLLVFYNLDPFIGAESRTHDAATLTIDADANR